MQSPELQRLCSHVVSRVMGGVRRSYASNIYGGSMKMREIIGFRSVDGFSIANLVGSKLNIGGTTIYFKPH